jgi:CRP-like cAMP-binding protein
MLAALGPVRTIAANHDMVVQGSQPDHSTVLINGFAARYKIGPDGLRPITALHVPGDFVDLHSYLLRRMDHGVLAVSECQIAPVPHKALDVLTDRYRGLGKLLWLSTLVDAAIHRTWLAQMGRGVDAYMRTAHFICEIFERLRAVGRASADDFSLHLTQQVLSDTLGISAVHMNRTLRQMKSDGLVSWRQGSLIVHDFERLSEIAAFDGTYLNLIETPVSVQSVASEGLCRVSQ